MTGDAASRPVLELRGVTRSYSSGRRRGRVLALDGIDLDLAAGELVGLVGASGSGKSTLARIACGAITPDEGRVVVAGRPFFVDGAPSAAERARLVQLVAQDPGASLDPRWTVRELVLEGVAASEGRRAGRDAARAAALLHDVGLDEALLGLRPVALSAGQKQRVALARALSLRPRVLVLDEPLAALDVTVGAQILGLLATIARSDERGILFVSHDLASVAAACSRLVVLDAGRVVEAGRTAEILARPGHPATRRLNEAVP